VNVPKKHPALRMVYWRLCGFDGAGEFIGGVETYLRNLAECSAAMGLDAVLYQCATQPFSRTVGALSVRGIVTPALVNGRRTRQALHRAALDDLEVNRDVLLFGADQWSVPTRYPRAVHIQHGIHWDRPIQYLSRRSICRNHEWAERLKRYMERRARLRSFEMCPNRVCVDYNFLNWYRTYRTCDARTPTWVVPNATPIVEPAAIHAKLTAADSEVRVLFARRFEEFRGSRMMAEVAVALLSRFPFLRFTFAGDGTDEEWLRARFEGESRVTIRKVPWEERIQLHFDHHIVVVPSIGSEGTSLSVAEAMATGCAVVAFDTGGVTNMIIDGFNGLMVSPERSALERAIARVIESESLRRQLAGRGYDVARAAFSMATWKERWTGILTYLRSRAPSV
jgi:glycosyltransferase involved in cell wall biosynthesis